MIAVPALPAPSAWLAALPPASETDCAVAGAVLKTMDKPVSVRLWTETSTVAPTPALAALDGRQGSRLQAERSRDRKLSLHACRWPDLEGRALSAYAPDEADTVSFRNLAYASLGSIATVDVQYDFNVMMIQVQPPGAPPLPDGGRFRETVASLATRYRLERNGLGWRVVGKVVIGGRER